MAEVEHPGLCWGAEIFGPALATVLTGSRAETTTGIAATATGYVSAALLRALPAARVLPLVIECGTLDAQTVAKTVRDDNRLHRSGGPLAAPEGERVKTALRRAFIPEDPTWQRTCLDVALSRFDRALGALTADSARAPIAAAPVTATTPSNVLPGGPLALEAMASASASAPSKCSPASA